jgi:hypothetical protein
MHPGTPVDEDPQFLGGLGMSLCAGWHDDSHFVGPLFHLAGVGYTEPPLATAESRQAVKEDLSKHP